jgi:CRISPR-associated endonuclease/helicase Cas3
MMRAFPLLAWPGKSRASLDLPEHPAVFHMLDVAAVAEKLIEPFAFPHPVEQALIFLTALHDLGKVNADFRAMIRGAKRQGLSHWEVSDLLLTEAQDLLLPYLNIQSITELAPLISATSGHHGRPPQGLAGREVRKAKHWIGLEAAQDARTLIVDFAALWPEASLEGLVWDEIIALSWWLPGFVSAADWVGSNIDWFPAVGVDMALSAYLNAARAKAKNAVEHAGFFHPTASANTLFSFPLRPMQEACRDAPLPEGPMLAVIEDETGAGKTEAALILAQRMLQAGKGRGLFFALPTMATADAMFRRVKTIVRKMFEAPPNLTLAHGRAGLSVDFRELAEGNTNTPEDVGCTEWLADSRRKALLADVGVGTIDQALLSVLPVKWQTLRHFGLSSKILIVDEVHELGEPYIESTLIQLLRMHRRAGGSAILLTATLPLAQRQRLMAVYETAADHPAYPALSLSGGFARYDLPQAVGARGPVRVHRLETAAEAVEVLARAVGQRAACVWVRNAVDDAIAGVSLLRQCGIEARLLHARFALGDRKRIEAELMGVLGKDGQGRAGQVFVTTQVFQASLDADVDVMVSDLAPMADLIQRAGRLWRHMDLRPAAVRPVPKPVMHVLSPDPAVVADAQWLTRVLDRGAYVYPMPDQWRTADHLFRVGEIVAPSGLRGLVEAVHGKATVDVPEALTRAEIEAEGKGLAAAALGWQNVVNLEEGYAKGGQALNDATYPTRLGQPQRVLVLARLATTGLQPLFDGPEGWPLSEVSASVSRLSGLTLPNQTTPAIAAVTALWPEWKREAAVLCPLGEDGAICDGLRYDRDLGLVFEADRKQ